MEHGDVTLIINGQSCVLRYDWRAIRDLIQDIGTDFDTVIANASAGYETPVIAAALNVGLKRHHPGEYTVDKIMDLSPPLIPAMRAVNDAMMVSFYGSTTPPDDPEKKTPIRSWILKMIRKIMRI
jgi:hypothetical protein